MIIILDIFKIEIYTLKIMACFFIFKYIAY